MKRKSPWTYRRSNEAPLVELKFHVGDVVHEVGDSELGTIEFIRRDGFACIQWKSGSKEWLSQDVLCGPLLQ